MDVNEGMLGMFWYWVSERHLIYLERLEGKPRPWSQDPIFLNYFFCNVFRELDPGTRWLRENWTDKHSQEGPLLVFNCVLYRLFNLESTAAALGFQTDWNEWPAIRQLEMMSKAGQTLYSSAYMTRGEKKIPKYITHCRLLTEVWLDKQNLYDDISRYNSLQHTTGLLDTYPGIGPFTGYEIATDLRHTPVLEKAEDIMTWANAGPGCWRGLCHIFPNLPTGLGGKELVMAVDLMTILLNSRKRWVGDHIPEMEMRDIEHSLCEFDKYVRASRGGGHVRRYDGGQIETNLQVERI